MMSAPTFSFPEFSGKSVLITGASTGIGAALARAFAAQGAKVGLHYNSSREAAETLAREIEGAGGTAVLAHRQGTKPVRCYAPHRFFLILSGLATGASWLCYFRALQIGDASRVAPLDKLSVVFVAVIAAVFLGERLSGLNWGGVPLIAAGSILVAVG